MKKLDPHPFWKQLDKKYMITYHDPPLFGKRMYLKKDNTSQSSVITIEPTINEIKFFRFYLPQWNEGNILLVENKKDRVCRLEYKMKTKQYLALPPTKKIPLDFIIKTNKSHFINFRQDFLRKTLSFSINTIYLDDYVG